MTKIKAIAKHDYMDSVWDVWFQYRKSNDTGWHPYSHVRVVANGKYDAIIEAADVAGISRVLAKEIAGEA